MMDMQIKSSYYALRAVAQVWGLRPQVALTLYDAAEKAGLPQEDINTLAEDYTEFCKRRAYVGYISYLHLGDCFLSYAIERTCPEPTCPEPVSQPSTNISRALQDLRTANMEIASLTLDTNDLRRKLTQQETRTKVLLVLLVLTAVASLALGFSLGVSTITDKALVLQEHAASTLLDDDDQLTNSTRLNILRAAGSLPK